MAKKRTTKSGTARKRPAVSKRGRRQKPPVPCVCPEHYARRQALYRWYIVAIEKVLLEADATAPENSKEYVAAIATAITNIGTAARGAAAMAESECEPPYECCDGLCAPMCGI